MAAVFPIKLLKVKDIKQGGTTWQEVLEQISPSYNHSVPKSLDSHYLEELAAEEQSQENDITRAPIYSLQSLVWMDGLEKR